MDWRETIESTPNSEIADYIQAAKSQQAELSFTAGKEEGKEENRKEVNALHRERRGEVWYWLGDGEDHLENLTCPVLIEAEILRELINKSKEEGRKEVIEWVRKYYEGKQLLDSLTGKAQLKDWGNK